MAGKFKRLSSIFIALFIAMLTGCAVGQPGVSPPAPTTRTSLPPTITITATARLVQRPTITPTFLPTLTAALPQSTQDRPYRLQPWTAAQAQLAVAQIASYLDATARDTHGVYGQADHQMQHRYLAMAEQEALLRFKDASQAEAWRWDLGYNLALAEAHAEDPNAPELKQFAGLIEEGLNSGETTPQDLPNWFTSHGTGLTFEMATLEPLQDSYAFSLDDSALFWMTQQKGKYHVYGLRSSMGYYREAVGTYAFADLTGDGFPELILDFSRANCCGVYRIKFVYEISHGIPRFLQSVSSLGTNEILQSDNKEQAPGFVFKGDYSDPIIVPCQLKEYNRYTWNGNEFELAETWYGIDPPGEYDQQELCQYAIGLATGKPEAEVIVKAIDQITFLPATEQAKGIDYRAGIRYRLGEYYARVRNVSKAREMLSDLVAHPFAPEEPGWIWSQAAKEFLARYQAAGDYYRACTAVERCDLDTALSSLIERLSPEETLRASDALRGAGVTITASGIFDFDDDRQMEQWFVARARKNTRELWVIVQTAKGPRGLLAAEVGSDHPQLKEFYGYEATPIMEVDGKQHFSLKRLAAGEIPYVETTRLIKADTATDRADFLAQALERAKDDLFAGQDPAEIRRRLLAIQSTPGFDCKKLFVCDTLGYLLGLSAELSGDEQNAVKDYLTLWKDDPDSPLTIVARLKLKQ